MNVDAFLAVSSVAARQHALVTRAQLATAGFSPDEIRSLTARRVLRLVRPRVFALAGCPQSWQRSLHAIVLSAGTAAAAAGASAARLWQFRYEPETLFEVVTPLERRVRLRGVAVRRATVLTPADLTTLDHIRVTSFERTLCDCSTRLTEFQLGRVLDDGLRRGVASLRRLEACLQRLRPGPGRSPARIRRLLDARGTGYDPGGSAAERRVLDVLSAAGLPLPVQQHEVRVDGRRYVLDFAYVAERAFVEFYGLGVHFGTSAVAYDSARLSALSAAGWTPLVFTDATPDRTMVEQVRRVLGLSGLSALSDISGPPPSSAGFGRSEAWATQA